MDKRLKKSAKIIYEYTSSMDECHFLAVSTVSPSQLLRLRSPNHFRCECQKHWKIEHSNFTIHPWWETFVIDRYKALRLFTCSSHPSSHDSTWSSPPPPLDFHFDIAGWAAPCRILPAACNQAAAPLSRLSVSLACCAADSCALLDFSCVSFVPFP